MNRCLLILAAAAFCTAGCAKEPDYFELNSKTGIVGYSGGFSSAGAQRMKFELQRLAKELSRRTGWELTSDTFIFMSQEKHRNAVFFLCAARDIDNDSLIHVTPQSVRVDVVPTKDFSDAVNTLLDNLVEKDGMFYWPVGTIKPGASAPAADKKS